MLKLIVWCNLSTNANLELGHPRTTDLPRSGEVLILLRLSLRLLLTFTFTMRTFAITTRAFACGIDVRCHHLCIRSHCLHIQKASMYKGMFASGK